MRKIYFLLISALLWGVACQSKQEEAPIVPEIPEEVTPPEEPDTVIRPVMTLYDKPLSTIQKVIEGKWKVYSCSSSGVDYVITYPEDWYMEFRNDRYIRDEYGKRDTVYIIWKKLTIENWQDTLRGHTTYMFCNKQYGEYNGNYFRSIDNDMLNYHKDSMLDYIAVRVK
jgi:hypothetical protein